MLIEGDNYHALSVLSYTHEKKVDVIYIDPPYNTGAKDWKYNNNFIDTNDAYRHSKWLSMMDKRLRLAKQLLKLDGVLICAIDENEVNRLGLLLEEIFNTHEIHCVTIVHNPRGIQGKNFSYTHEYAFFCIPRGKKTIGRRRIKEEDIDWRNLRDNGGVSLRTDARNCFYPVIVKDEQIIGFGDVVPSNKHPQKQTMKKGEEFYVYPIDPKGIERKWRYARQSVEDIKTLLRVKKTKNGYEIEIGKDFGTVRTVWQDSRYDSNENGTKLVHALVPSSHFDFPKSVYNTYDCISPILNKKRDAVVLDFFAGSGTTGHAVSILNKEDGGNRRFILCTNNDNGIAREVCYPRIKAVIKGHKEYPEITKVPSNLKYYRTSFVPAEPSDENKEILTRKSVEMLCLRENTFEFVTETDTWKIYKNKNQYTAILFDQLSIPDLREELAKLDKPISVYIFSLEDDNFASEFIDMKGKVKVCSIPEAILRVYRRIYK
ncbi:MAG: site-specific DNA-methyltransferase [Anaerolineales bacterium]|nr:site-specific DNA-methyltransferase [Anaerolineales bacterium]